MVVDGITWPEVFELEYLTDLDFAVLERHPLDPFNRFFLGFHLNQPETRDELLGFRKRPVDDGPFVTGESDARTFRAGLKALSREHHPGLDHLFVELSHR